MNQETTNSSLTNDLSRRQHRTRTVRRCRLRVLNPQSHLPRSAVDIAGQSDENPPIPNVTDGRGQAKKTEVLPGTKQFGSKSLRGRKKV
jgi:hypothetical protein